MPSDMHRSNLKKQLHFYLFPPKKSNLAVFYQNGSNLYMVLLLFLYEFQILSNYFFFVFLPLHKYYIIEHEVLPE